MHQVCWHFSQVANCSNVKTFTDTELHPRGPLHHPSIVTLSGTSAAVALASAAASGSVTTNGSGREPALEGGASSDAMEAVCTCARRPRMGEGGASASAASTSGASASKI